MSNSPSTSASVTPTGVASPGKAPRIPLFSSDAWSPLKVELFRSLWVATSIAQVGTWTREAAGPWLMNLMTEHQANSPAMVSKVLTFSNLPICLFSVFAGAMADVLDRRKLLIVTQTWMLIFSAVLGLLTLSHHISPGGLLGLTFLLGVGTAAAGPALQAVLPELVPKKDFALAINLNSVALNVARALGPALFILVVTVPGLTGYRGVGTSFLLSGITFTGAIWVLWSWKRPSQRAALDGEAIWSGIRAGFLYTIHSPANRAILLRVAAFIIPAVVFWSQVPVIAEQQLHFEGPSAERVSALLFAFMGAGAILGVLLMPGLHARFKIDPVVNVCIAFFAAGLVLLSFVHHLWLAGLILIFLGINWVIIPTNFNTATQKSVPPWVKGRAISFYLTVLFGSFAVGGALWGRMTTSFTTLTAENVVVHPGIGASLLIAGLAMGALLLLAIKFPLTLNDGMDLTPATVTGADATALPLIAATTTDAPPIDPSSPAGGLKSEGVFVSILYQVDSTNRAAFVSAMKDLKRQRQQSGAMKWSLTQSGSGDFTERFQFRSTAEQARQAARLTKADVSLHDRVVSLHAGPDAPRISIERVI